MRKNYYFLAAVPLLFLITCDMNPTQNSLDSGDKVPVKLSMKINPVKGAPGCVSQDFQLKTLYLKLSAIDAETIYDTVALDGSYNEEFDISKVYSLKPLRSYTVEGFTKDINDSIIHTGTMLLPVRNEPEDMWEFDMFPKYYMLQAKIFPLSNYPKEYGEIYGWEMLIDNKVIAQNPEGSYPPGDTVYLNYNYVTLNQEHEIKLNVYGSYFHDGYLLYTGSIRKTVTYSSTELEPFSILLNWVGPEKIPFVSTGFFAFIEPVQQQIVNGKIETPPVHF